MNNSMNSKFHKQTGVSLIELMIALVIGLILTSGAIQIFISSKATFRMETALSRLQETGRFIVDVMAKEIRMAGYNGCSSRGVITPNVIANNPPPLDATPENAVTGFDGAGLNTWDPVLPASLEITGLPISNTDIITVNRAYECGASVSGNYLPTNANVQVNNPNGCGFAQNQAVLITDCIGADIYQISNSPGGAGNLQTTAHASGANTTNNVSKNYGPESQVFRYLSNTFYIADSDNSGEPALWLSTWFPGYINSPPNPNYDAATGFLKSELADGVEDMQILYGVNTGGTDDYADTYVRADQVTDWLEVKSVRINLLLRSDDRITDEPRSITFNGNPVNSGAGADNRLRMVYSATITLRNRLP